MKLMNRTAKPTRSESKSRPNWLAKIPRGEDEKMERIGAAWTREDGGICLRLYGTQIVSADIYLFPIDQTGDDAGR
jgi:hypothetical protein